MTASKSRDGAEAGYKARLQLFAESGGYCQNPDCNEPLFDGSTDIHFAELAHVIPAGDHGPRADATVPKNALGSAANLILLCANCHTLIDKKPGTYPPELLKSWKKAHQEKITAVFAAGRADTRDVARAKVEPLFAANYATWKQYGPDSDERFNPESDSANIWKRKIRAVILVNNRSILRIADANRKFLDLGEKELLETFRQHVEDMEAKHLGGVPEAGRPFPSAIAGIFSTSS
jgi:HNH endonuclease